ncbi:hypothetical protein QQS21_003977 [Conoideocrella luteorostrata]|uniref:Uncharacterized protein n=1 Tax=Conoideocrella luteorostrata TaxID=1105319 RepID=A0AAJ0G1X8_9HYPO|nr:hypothetical protein QQS21_003977 [Conoideocrella luteorostrata]
MAILQLDQSSAVPYPGKVFVIRDRIHSRAITLIDGTLKLMDDSNATGNCNWACIETDIYFGFCNKASKCYIGHNGRGKVICAAAKHDSHESIIARPHPDGGYELLMSHWGNKLLVGIAEDGESLIATDQEGVTWDFTVVST